MRTLQQICGMTILALVLAVSALAGEIDCPGVIQPPPPQTETTVTTSDVPTTIILTIVSLIN